MAESIDNKTALDYIMGLFPGVAVSEAIISNIIFKTGIDLEMPLDDLDERQRDLAYAYLILFLSPGMGSSQKVTDRDGDWEHSESVSSWSYTDRNRLLGIARALLKKWGIEEELADAAGGKWGFKGTGFTKIRRY
jgi:hypothetical protein